MCRSRWILTSSCYPELAEPVPLGGYRELSGLRELPSGVHPEHAALRPYGKNGAKLSDFLKNRAAQGAFAALRDGFCADAALVCAHYAAAADPESACPLELYVGASD